MPDLPIALINIKDGWLKDFDFSRFHFLFEDVPEPPALVMVNEAVQWAADRGHGKYAAAAALSQMYGTHYGVEVGWIDRSDHPPAVLYDASRLWMTSWADEHSCRAVKSRNTADFSFAGTAKRVGDKPDLRVQVCHFDFVSGDRRLLEAHDVVGVLNPDVPTVVAGDFNGTASGPHMPDKRWDWVAGHKIHHKGMPSNGPGSERVADTRAVDALIGVWDAGLKGRVDNPGLWALAEDDWVRRGCPDEPVLPTTNTPPGDGGSLLIDWILRNRHIALVPDTYRVHIPRRGREQSDHRLVTATISVNES
jgi:endonuclease/exonuclease/phosphatase family metal-dependent hydrolase